MGDRSVWGHRLCLAAQAQGRTGRALLVDSAHFLVDPAHFLVDFPVQTPQLNTSSPPQEATGTSSCVFLCHTMDWER